MWYSSCVTLYVLPFMWYPSCVTFYVIPFTCYPLCDILYVLLFMWYSLCVTLYVIPFMCYPLCYTLYVLSCLWYLSCVTPYVIPFMCYPLCVILSAFFHEYIYTKIVLPIKPVMNTWKRKLSKNGGDIWRWRPTLEFVILAWTLCRRIKGPECVQLQATVYKTDCSCMYSYFIAITTNLLSPSVVLL